MEKQQNAAESILSLFNSNNELKSTANWLSYYLINYINNDENFSFQTTFEQKEFFLELLQFLIEQEFQLYIYLQQLIQYYNHSIKDFRIFPELLSADYYNQHIYQSPSYIDIFINKSFSLILQNANNPYYIMNLVYCQNDRMYKIAVGISKIFYEIFGNYDKVYDINPTPALLNFINNIYSQYTSRQNCPHFWSLKNIGEFWFHVGICSGHIVIFNKWIGLGGNLDNLSSNEFELENIKNKLLPRKDIHGCRAGAAGLINIPLTPFKLYLRTSLYGKNLIYDEAYFRSADHWLSHKVKRDFEIDPRLNQMNLGHGMRAHLGFYLNPMQSLGDTSTPANRNKKTTSGNSELYNKLLKYQLKLCGHIAVYFQSVYLTPALKIGFYNEYPCLMVKITPPDLFRKNVADTNEISLITISESCKEAWTNFVISFFIGLVNYNAYKNNISIEMVRRSSFGFISPTIAATGSSMRINLGIVPLQYLDIIKTSLQSLDIALRWFYYVQENKNLPQNHSYQNKNPFGNSCLFFQSPDYSEYISAANADKKDIYLIRSLVELFFTKAEKGKNGQTTIQNIVRTSFALNKISIHTFNSLFAENKTSTDVLFRVAWWTVMQLTVDKDTLTFKQVDNTIIQHRFKNLTNIKKIEDNDFWNLVMYVKGKFQTENLTNNLFKKVLAEIYTSYQNQSVLNLHYQLEYLNELLYIKAIEDAENQTDIDDGYGSDSDEEGDVEQTKVYAKKLVTHNGMYAITSVLLGINQYSFTLKPLSTNTIFADNTIYYEVNHVIKKLNEIGTNINRVEHVEDANVIIYDINSCITQDKPISNFYTQILNNTHLINQKIIIFDSTSAIIEKCHRFLSWAVNQAHAVIFVSSGLKHEQIGADKNAYGTIRIFSKDQSTRDKLYNLIKQSTWLLGLGPLLSPVSHIHRRLMKKLDAVPVNRLFFNPYNINNIHSAQLSTSTTALNTDNHLSENNIENLSHSLTHLSLK